MSARPARRSFTRVVLAIVFVFAMLSAQGSPLRGYWREARAGDRPEAIRALPESASAQSFDPARLNAIRAGEHGAWVLLWPDTTATTPAEVGAVLSIIDPGIQRVSLFPAQGPPILGAGLLDPRRGWMGNGRIGFPIDRGELDSAPILLRVEPGRVIAPPIRFELVDGDRFRREDARWLAIATASLAIMAAMAVMALLFALELRDMTFLWYAGYVLAYAVILAVQTGYVAEPLHWSWAAAAPNAWGRAATALSVFFATLFVSRFAELSRYAQRMRIAVLAMGISTGVLMTLGSLPVPLLIRVSSLLINPLLILGGPIILAASLIAWWRGSRYAGFFLLGWTPLLAITVCGSAQVFGVLATWTWLGDASFIAGAFEALVLSLGLADRALALRHDRDVAQALADTDGLTSVFNRRGLDRRIGKLVESAHRQRRPLTLLFLDLDRFKLLNDRQGHAAGDAALVAVTRLMRSDMRGHDVLGRYGGEEFLAALPGCDLEAAQAIAERIRVDLEGLGIPVESPGDALTASLGVARLDRGEDAPALIARADQAMYVAKRAGGNRVAANEALDAATGVPSIGAAK